MNYAEQRSPTRNLTGIGLVVLLHVLLGYALVTGLAKKVVDIVKAPLEVKVIEETAKPPPPPDLPPPPPKLLAPPPPFIPPPEITVAQPPPPAPTISVTTSEPPPAPQTIAPVQAPVQATAPPAPPAPRTAAAVCPNVQAVAQAVKYPREAQLDGLQGEVTLELTIAANGQIKDVAVVKSSNRVFNRSAVSAAQQLECKGLGQDIKVSWVVGFKLN
jgi:protein TonB